MDVQQTQQEYKIRRRCRWTLSVNDNRRNSNVAYTENNSEKLCLVLWTTFPYLKEQISIIERWGFTYKTLGFSWIKTNPKNGKPFFGVGYYAKSNCEVCLLGIKGRMKAVSNKVSSCLISARREHSRKPDEARERIVELFGDIPRIELFAREQVNGWDCWGNQVS